MEESGLAVRGTVDILLEPCFRSQYIGFGMNYSVLTLRRPGVSYFSPAAEEISPGRFL
jgi:hypothetical protein